MVAAVASFLAVGTGFHYSSADQFFLNLQVNVFRNNGFVVTFYIVLRDETVVLDSGFVQKVCCVDFLEQGITDVFQVAQDLVDGASVTHFSSCTGKDTVTFQPSGNLIHAESF